jgi:hypothetical protein
VGAAIWGGCDWWNHNVIINVNRYNLFNHSNINIANNTWIHNPAHRHDIPYPNASVAQRFGRANEAAARDAFRDRADAQHDDFFKDRPNAERDGVSRDRADVERPDTLRRTEDDADRRIAPAMPDRRDEEVRRDVGDRAVDRAMPERREFAPSRGDAGRQVTRPRAQMFRPERRAMGGGFHFHGGGRHRL